MVPEEGVEVPVHEAAESARADSRLEGRNQQVAGSHNDRPPLVAHTPLVLTLITLCGVVVRWPLMGDSFSWDELFTYAITADTSLADVMAGVLSDDEMTPPLYFVVAWAAQHLGDPFLWLRMVSLVAGIAAILLTYVLGARTVGRGPGLLGAAMLALSPMAALHSAEARGYALLTTLVLLSTLALLRALATGARRWWLAVAVLYAAVMYTHYAGAFVLAAQTLWATWAHRDQWRPLLASVTGAALLFSPWLPAFVADSRAPNQAIIGIIAPFGPETVVSQMARLLAGHSYAQLSALPGLPAALCLLASAAFVVVGVTLRAVSGGWSRPSAQAGLIIACAAAAPVGAAVYSALGDDLFIARNLLASLPSICLAVAALMLALPRRIAAAAVILALVGMGLAAAQSLDVDNRRPPTAEVAAYLNERAVAGDVIVEYNSLVGPPATALEVHLDSSLVLARVRPGVAPDAAAAPVGRVFLVGTGTALDTYPPSFLPPNYRQTAAMSFRGGSSTFPIAMNELQVRTFEPDPAADTEVRNGSSPS